MSDANQDQRPPAKPSGREGGRGVRLALVAVLAAASAVVGALLVCLALWATGNLGGTRLVVRADGTDQVAHSIDVITTQEDTTIPEAVAAKAMPSVVLVEVSYDRSGSIGSTGSGVIYDDGGHIITNYHVIEGGESISISYDGQSYDAEVVGSDPSSDLAVLHVDFGDQEVTPIERGDSDQLIVGDWVMAVGHPYGLDQSASQGIVSALYSSTMLSSASGNTLYTNLIQTDAAVNPGNSGGALVNDQGQLVGITTLNATADEGGANAGVAFAIPGNYAMEIADTIIAGDEVEHAYVGVSVQTVNATNAEALGVAVDQGAFVGAVTPGGPAEAAGLREGDVIVAVNDEEIASADALILAIRSHEIGDDVVLTVYRGSEELSFEATLGSDAGTQTPSDSSRD